MSNSYSCAASGSVVALYVDSVVSVQRDLRGCGIG